MELRPGDIVINPAMPQWGTGEVLTVADGKAMVRFQRNVIRKMAVSFLALAETGECPELPPARGAQKKTSSPAPAPDSSGLIAQAMAMMQGQSADEPLPADPALNAAERAADFAADVKRKEREDAKLRRDAAILRFWRDVEVFSIPEAPRSSRPPIGKGRRWETVSASLSVFEGGPLPWERPLPTGFEAAWHIVYLGVLPKQRITDIILEKTGSEAEYAEEPGTGDGCLAAVVLDLNGMPLESSYMPASLVPGIWRVLRGKDLDGLPLDMLKMQSEFDRKADSLNEPFRWLWIQAEIEHLFVTMDLDVEREDMRVVIRSVYFRPDPKGRRIEDVQNDLLNSFFLNDLDRLLALSKFGFGGVFGRWLDESSPVRRDVLSGSEEGRRALEDSLSLRRMPRGRWPFRPSQHLLPAQLGAVSTILNSELSAVNGPPGTGKTRLLCEVAAHLVVERASRIARCRQPYEVFTAASGDFYPLRESIMRGTCMVAVSSNNAAVENITRFLPAEEAVNREAFPEAAYFPEVASAVNTACTSPDAEDSGPRPTWGLMAAVLGSAWNCDQFARSFFWGFRDPEKNISLPGMKQVLDGFRDYDTRQKAREEWQKARADFLETSRLIEDRLALLEKKAASGNLQAQEKGEASGMLSQFLELMAQSKALQSTAREEDRAIQELASRLETLESVVKQAQAEIAAQQKARKARLDDLRVPGRAFRDDPDWQLKSVWNDEELALLRTRLFLQALRLHEWTIKACPREFTANISVITRYLRGVLVDEAEAEEIWNALFFMVPVVSSTLASFSRLFSGMGQASLDWVLLDEAGQASPQSAAGALWRARRAAIIGDPQQIEPVVPQPASLIETLKERVRHSDARNSTLDLEGWSPLGQSAQTLADRNAELGTWMDCSGHRVWTGFPLRAHHRCAEPMFSIANRIAYDSQMVQARSVFPFVRSPLGRSCWLNVRGHVADGQLVQEELACLRRCILEFQKDWPAVEGTDGPREASVFVISPFRKVAWHCRSLLRAMRMPEERVRCGTIHTFQGREADIVFLVLGSSPGQAGWGSRQWASRTPNILNVAVTRAKALLYVIGNWSDWRRHPFFDVLSEELPMEAGGEDYLSPGNSTSENRSSSRLSALLRPAGSGKTPSLPEDSLDS